MLAHDLALGFHQLRQCLAAFFVIAPTAVGQLDAAGGARKQAHAETFFHARHRAAHRGWSDARHQRGGSEAAGFGGQAKQFDTAQLKIVELSLHD
ncbi:hypothetical protein D3C76_1383700 [compost metagenome]